MDTFRREVVEEKDDEEEDAPRLQVPRALTLRHPGGFDTVNFGFEGRCPWGGSVSSQLFVWISLTVSGRQRNRNASHGEN
jgi:hypothetical protein